MLMLSIECGVRIGWRKYLYECTAFRYVNLWTWEWRKLTWNAANSSSMLGLGEWLDWLVCRIAPDVFPSNIDSNLLFFKDSRLSEKNYFAIKMFHYNCPKLIVCVCFEDGRLTLVLHVYMTWITYTVKSRVNILRTMVTNGKYLPMANFL